MTRRRRAIGGSRSYKAWKDWSPGDYVIGKFVGESIDQYDKPNFHIELEEVCMANPVASNGKALVVGVVLGLNAAGTLNDKMAELSKGSIVEITYNGTETLPENHRFKGKECHQIDVAELEEEGGNSNEEEDIDPTSMV